MADAKVAGGVAANGATDGPALPKLADQNGPTITLRIAGKWKGKLSIPKSASVSDLRFQLAAASKIPEDSQQLIFRGKKMLDFESKIAALGIKNKSSVYLRLIAQPIRTLAPSDEDIKKKSISDMKDKLAAQGAGKISDKMAQQYIELVSTGKKTGVPTTNLVLDAVRLYYKSNGKIDAARNIRRVETATNKLASDASKASTTASQNSTATATKAEQMAAGKDSEEVESGSADAQEAEPKKKKKKKKKTYKQLMNDVVLRRQTSDERQKAHKEYLEKNLGGGEFDKLDKI